MEGRLPRGQVPPHIAPRRDEHRLYRLERARRAMRIGAGQTRYRALGSKDSGTDVAQRQAALYAAKAGGRARVEVHDSGPVIGDPQGRPLVRTRQRRTRSPYTTSAREALSPAMPR